MLDGIYQMNPDFLEVVRRYTIFFKVGEGVVLSKLREFEGSGLAPLVVAISLVQLDSMNKGMGYFESILVLGQGSERTQFGLVCHLEHLLLLLGNGFELFPSVLK